MHAQNKNKVMCFASRLSIPGRKEALILPCRNLTQVGGRTCRRLGESFLFSSSKDPGVKSQFSTPLFEARICEIIWVTTMSYNNWLTVTWETIDQ